MLPFYSRKELHTYMNRTHGFSRDFYMISPALAPQSSVSPSSLRIHFSVSATCPRFSGVHAKFNASSSSLPKRKGIGMDLVCKREGIFRRQQASDCKPTHVANLRLGTWLLGFQKFGIWFIDTYCLRRCCLCTGQRHWIHFCFKPDENDKPINPQTRQKQKSAKGKLDTLPDTLRRGVFGFIGRLQAKQDSSTLILKKPSTSFHSIRSLPFCTYLIFAFYLSANSSMCT